MFFFFKFTENKKLLYVVYIFLVKQKTRVLFSLFFYLLPGKDTDINTSKLVKGQLFESEGINKTIKLPCKNYPLYAML